MRKCLSVIGLFLIALCATVAFAACNKQEDHQHAYGEWRTVTEATCTAEGTQERVCSCGESESRPIAPLPHTPESVEAKPATCTEDGYTEGKRCSVCHTPLEGMEPIKGGHIEVAIIEPQEATCDHKGMTAGRQCSVCGDILEAPHEIDKLPHQLIPYGEAAAPDCKTEKPGHTQGQQCSVCKQIIVEPQKIPAEHTWGSVVVTKEPTCTQPGVMSATCTVCGTALTNEPIGALGHEWEYTFASATESGTEKICYHTKRCTRVGCEEADQEPCELSSDITPATCTKAAHHVHSCQLCLHSYEHDEGAALGHNYSAWEFDEEAYLNSINNGDRIAVRMHKRVCTNPGHVPDEGETDIVNCTPVVVQSHSATCTEAGYTEYSCELCHKTYTDNRVNALGHEWKQVDGKTELTHLYYEAAHQHIHYKTCSRCSETSGYFACRFTTSQWISATCEKGAMQVYTCEDCGYRDEQSRGEPRGHNYSAWTHDPDTSGSESYHMRTCQYSDCNDVQRVKCTMVTSEKLPTCQLKGSSVTACKDCLYTSDKQTFDKLQHKYPNTYTADGKHKTHSRACELCGDIEKTDCQYNVTQTDPATCTTVEIQHYSCSLCKDEYIVKNGQAFGHVVNDWHESADGKKHEGNCATCHQPVSQAHDYTETNICSVCEHDGLTYRFITGTDNTQAIVSGSAIPGYEYQGIYAPKLPSKTVIIADIWQGAKVTAIATNAFLHDTNVQELVLPKHLETIGIGAFSGCTSLRHVKLQGHNYGEENIADVALKRIESTAFRNCSSLESAVFPETLLYIGADAFNGCAALADIKIPTSVTEIDACAFEGTAFYKNRSNWTDNKALYINNHLVRVWADTATGAFEIRDGVVSVSEEAFKGCTEITSVKIPASVTVFDKYAFEGCVGLTSVEYAGNFTQYLAIKFLNDTASPMFYASTLTIEGATGVIEIPKGTTSIPAGAFRGSSITGVVIHKEVESIGSQAFKDCASLEYIFIEEGTKLSAIGADAFTGSKFYTTDSNWTNGILYLKNQNGTFPAEHGSVSTPQLTGENSSIAVVGSKTAEVNETVTIEEGTRIIAGEAFKDCTNLKNVTLAKTLVYIGADAFSGSGLVSLTFTSDGGSWFAYGESLGRLLSEQYLRNDPSVTAYQILNLYTKEWKKQN